ncbi:hypothetical protein [Streptomyces sp. NBC_00525]|uniref:hypothetical protein n=1 Tax=Streptomyces sp. NBC_00525 TaxID=2903660 RepID=UPI002E7FCF81|nr:hypothetical protein [Streptomyces sp. NBC_00525]WUC93740.1 hypothetical protein OG710_09030 [Streptomyces sp. NBC_00525]
MKKGEVPAPDLKRWTEEGRLTIIDVADILGVPPDIYTSDPLNLTPARQSYTTRLPFHEFEQSDWITFQTDLMAYVADFFIQRHGAKRVVINDSTTPLGYRYAIEATGRDGRVRTADPAEILREELKNSPIEIVRMPASAELTLHLTRQVNEEGPANPRD